MKFIGGRGEEVTGTTARVVRRLGFSFPTAPSACAPRLPRGDRSCVDERFHMHARKSVARVSYDNSPPFSSDAARTLW